MRVQQAGFVNRDMTTQVAHKRQCSEQRALRGVTKGLQVKSYAGDGMGPGSDKIHEELIYMKRGGTRFNDDTNISTEMISHGPRL